jgi:hypothetical protein
MRYRGRCARQPADPGLTSGLPRVGEGYDGGLTSARS